MACELSPKKTRVIKLHKVNGQVCDYDVYIGRAFNKGGYDLLQSKWCNPFKRVIGQPGRSKELYRDWIKGQPALLAQIEELRGKTLACWCKVTPDAPCHGDVLLELLGEIETSRDEIELINDGASRDNANQKLKCKICFVGEIGSVLMPCGHMVCRGCASGRVVYCYFCRGKVDYCANVFFM